MKWNGVAADNVHAAGRRVDFIAGEGSLRRHVVRAACGGPGGLPLGSATHF